MTFQIVLALHIIAVISWMVGMLYLPRLFVYHSVSDVGSETSETFKVMEQKLMWVIVNPAMIATWIFGLSMLWLSDWAQLQGQGWMHAKLLLVVILSGVHGWFSRLRKQLARDERPHSQKFYRMINEIPTLIMIAVVFLVILKPF